MKRIRKAACVAAVAVLLLAAAGGICLFQAGNTEPQYKGIENVAFQMEYPPFDAYDLTTAEVNDLIGCLSVMDLSAYETSPLVPEGDGIQCTITTAGQDYEIIFLKPYLFYDGIIYKMEIDERIFGIVDRIEKDHR